MHPLESVRYRSAAKRRVRSAKVERAAPGSIALRRCGDECAVPPLEIEVQAMRLSPYRAGLAGRHRKRLPRSPASLTCSCPLQLSPSGQSDGPEVSLRTSPGCARDPTSRPAAHSFPATGSPGIGDFSGSLSSEPRGSRATPRIPQVISNYSSAVRQSPGVLPPVRGFPALRVLWRLRRLHASSMDCSSPRVSLPRSRR
jgi:hypothetical protein